MEQVTAGGIQRRDGSAGPVVVPFVELSIFDLMASTCNLQKTCLTLMRYGQAVVCRQVCFLKMVSERLPAA